MKLIRHLTWANMKSAKTRTLVTILGIVLSAAMFTAVTTMGVSLRAYLMNAEIAEWGDYFLRYDFGTSKQLEALQKDPDVTELGTMKALGFVTCSADSPEYGPIENTFLVGSGNAAFFDMIPTGLLDGRLPQSGSELLLSGTMQDYLRSNGIPCTIGDRITLSLNPEYDDSGLELPSDGGSSEKTFTIVGLTDYLDGTYELNLPTSLTFDDGTADGLWVDSFVKTHPADAFPMADDFATGVRTYGLSMSPNYNLLALHGESMYSNITDLIAGFALVLILIIMTGSVSLIYNAFSISISERTRQFGLLSSVGATRKQIRRCVFTEALYLSAAGIPLGILAGFTGISVTLRLTHGLIDSLLWTAAENDVILKAVPSLSAFAAAAFVALITVIISAWIPARRATKITPIAAIRQQKDFVVPKRGIRAGKWSQKLFGLPAALARKYFTVNKRKYRATVISLTISMVLFVCAGTFIEMLNQTALEQTNTDNFDLEITDLQVTGVTAEELENLRAQPFFADSALLFSDSAQTVIPEAAFTDGYRKAWNESMEGGASDREIGFKTVQIDYLEDAVLKAFLEKQGIDPQPYLDPVNPLALVTQAQLTAYRYSESGRPSERIRYTEQILSDSVNSLTLIPTVLPQEVTDQIDGNCYIRELKEVDGRLLNRVMVQKDSDDGIEESDVWVEVRPSEDGKDLSYFFMDEDTGLAQNSPATTVPAGRTSLRIGASIEELPMGIRTNYNGNTIRVILPLSAAPQHDGPGDLRVRVTDYDASLAFLDANGYFYIDYLEDQMTYRNYITMIRIFSYGFITLISLICICNVFNTISTNIALRRKDFGMLRSVGMKRKEINRMMTFECLQYGLKSLLWGVPLSILGSCLISRLLYVTNAFHLPWSSLCIAAGCIFLTVFISMFYAVRKLQKQNPIEAIRSED